jgi:hypothetical protein
MAMRMYIPFSICLRERNKEMKQREVARERKIEKW